MRDPFPNVPELEMVGPLRGRRFMEALSDHTLRGMSQGKAGEPPEAIAQAKRILAERQKGS